MNPQSLNRSIRVGVLRGGPSHEYDVSLKTGAHVLEHLPVPFAAKDILISREGEWHIDGAPRSPARALAQVDVVFNALHGKYGEDGKVQHMLKAFGVPFTGSHALSSALGMHKGLSKKMYEIHNIKTPISVVLSPQDNTWNRIVEVFQSFPQPSIIKPISGGSSRATTIAKDFNSFEKAVERAFKQGSSVLVEEYIVGREATCGVLDSLDNTKAFALFPIEIVTPNQKIFNDPDLLDGENQEICPSTFSHEIKTELQNLALLSHMALGLRHYSRSDFIVSQRGIYILETNSLPGLTSQSLYPRSLSAAGVTFPEFLQHVLVSTLSNSKNH